MWDSLLATLGGLQRGTIAGLAVESRAGGAAAAAFTFMLGAVHALAPGHGKTASKALRAW
ncbi:MAG: hypothetical protein GEU91_06365 [Rhizobiales bacterium]|nr:hypothetical protein [Hyphomicrobiales bacterium]